MINQEERIATVMKAIAGCSWDSSVWTDAELRETALAALDAAGVNALLELRQAVSDYLLADGMMSMVDARRRMRVLADVPEPRVKRPRLDDPPVHRGDRMIGAE